MLQCLFVVFFIYIYIYVYVTAIQTNCKYIPDHLSFVKLAFHKMFR